MNFFESEANLIAIAVFVVMAAVGVVIAQVLAKRGDRHASLRRRLNYVSNKQADSALDKELAIDADVFGDGADRQREGRIARLTQRLDQKLALIGGLRILRKAAPIGAGVGFVASIVAAAKLELPFTYALGFGVIVACASIVFGLRFMLQRTYDKFGTLFPDAIDLVVRSIRAGLPVSQALDNIGNDIGAPVGPEFARIANQMRIGVSLDDAMHAALRRIDLAEMRFFAVTLILQRETGGQLAEVLLNLSDTLRQRKAMKLKIKALTSEARAASKIVAAIPGLAAAGMYYLNKPHVMLLVETEVGQTMLAYCIGSIILGLFIIKKLTAVDA